jgi:uncharacterized membrane protein YkvA (DUF1232 family)
VNRLRSWARSIKADTFALYLAYKDPRTPWYGKALTAAVVAYALSPIDLIPDFIPVIGYLDDLIIVPLGMLLAFRLVPPDVLRDSREQARAMVDRDRSIGRYGLAMIIAVWVLFAVIVLAFLLRYIT